MLPNTYDLEKYAQMRHREMVEAARLERLIGETKEQRPKLWQKLTWLVGDWMIGFGHWLKYTQTLTSNLDFSGRKFEGAPDGPQNNNLYSK